MVGKRLGSGCQYGEDVAACCAVGTGKGERLDLCVSGSGGEGLDWRGNE